MNDDVKTHESVKEYYGQTLKTNDDLKTNACCLADSTPEYLKNILSEIHPDVLEKFYGCGSPVPYLVDGKKVVDLGCGSGRDCYLFSKLVGETGAVIGVDMTDEQLSVAVENKDYHAKKYGHAQSNVDFRKGFIEDLTSVGIESNSIDVVTSNCVINLSPNKEKVFSEIFRVLKPGGELYFSDVLTSRRLADEHAKDPVLVGECLGGALYIEDFRRLLNKVGCVDYRIVKQSNLEILNSEVEAKVGDVEFYSMTIRAFKLPLEDRFEDYGQSAEYMGGIKYSENEFVLDEENVFKKGMACPVSSNTAAILSDTRYASYFKIVGDKSTHFGLFNIDQAPAQKTEKKKSTGCC
jgi:arsenite methyltransferase